MDAFDTDVLIDAATSGTLGPRVRRASTRYGSSITEIDVVYPDALDDA